MFPEGTLGGLGGVVTFANFRPPASPALPIPGMTREDVAVSIFASAPATRAEEADAPVPAVAAADFHQRSNSPRGDAVATAELLSAGQVFHVWVEVGRGPPQPGLVAEANAVLASLRTDELSARAPEVAGRLTWLTPPPATRPARRARARGSPIR